MYVVSKCLLGYNCKYNGGNNKNEKVIKFCQNNEYVLVCPEEAGGLGTPRLPSEIVFEKELKACDVLEALEVGAAKVINIEGQDVTRQFLKGAQKEFLRIGDVEGAILKAKSPSCGVKKIYDGSFTGCLADGNGVFAQLLINNGVDVKTEKDL